ncbi:hypothetical protein Scep_016568 [Stephania cephalantha]|uniref:Uncharacterized protein n=1 Tax=Stephania cephalantha TaxID=152367 RepID=A0AAP0INF4_9MAGN
MSGSCEETSSVSSGSLKCSSTIENSSNSTLLDVSAFTSSSSQKRLRRQLFLIHQILKYSGNLSFEFCNFDFICFAYPPASGLEWCFEKANRRSYLSQCLQWFSVHVDDFVEKLVL